MEPFHIWSPSSDFLINILLGIYLKQRLGLRLDLHFLKMATHYRRCESCHCIQDSWLSDTAGHRSVGTAWIAGCWSGQRAKPDILAQFSSEERLHRCNTDSRALMLQWKSPSFCSALAAQVVKVALEMKGWGGRPSSQLSVLIVNVRAKLWATVQDAVKWEWISEWVVKSSNQLWSRRSVVFNEIRSIIMVKQKMCICCVHCVLCLIQTYNVNSYNILGLH